MRIGHVTIGGTEYPITMSTRAMMQMEAKGYNLTDIKQENVNVTFFVEMLHAMMVAGNRLEKRGGGNPPTVPAMDDLIDIIEPDEMEALTDQLMQVVDGERNVEAIPPKG